MTRVPRKLSEALRQAAQVAQPKTTLAAVQAAWGSAAGAEFAARCEPVGERDGVVEVICDSAVWAHELDLLQSEVIARLHSAGGLEQLRSLRVRVGDRPV